MLHFVVFILALTECKFASQLVSAAQLGQTTSSDFGAKVKRDAGSCPLPSPLKNGRYTPSSRRCTRPQDNSPACQMVPGTQVPKDWPIFYECDLGYTMSTADSSETTGRKVSVCTEGQWNPMLPECVESDFNSQNIPQSLASRESCGRPANHLRVDREGQGTVSQRGAWPWMVIFGTPKNNTQNDEIHWFCAGTLITTRHILTAAHCVADYRKRNMFIARLDDINLDDPSDNGQGAIEIEIHRNNIITHPGFKKERLFSHNLAIIKLNSELQITDFVRPICLPTPDFTKKSLDNQIAYFTSWGQTDDDLERKKKRRYEPILHELKATVVNHDDCKYKYRSYESDNWFVIVDWDLICASVPVNKSSQSDEGSPLMLKVKDRYVLVGIVATHFRYYDDQFPRLFTSVPLYLDWIISNLRV